jgi:tRNA threonylcarbamoyladenosine biosynthesis protein TsaB
VKLVLAIDTATDFGSVAVGHPGKVATELEFTQRRHASELMPSIVEALDSAGYGFGDLSHIVVADGPGSFTGLRIGFATARGIVREIPSLEVYIAPSLLGLAYGARQHVDGTVAALYDALRGEVFGAVYRFEADSVVTELAPTIGTVESLRQRSTVKPAIVVGDGAIQNREIAREWAGREPVGPPDLVPKAASLVDLLALDGAATRVGNLEKFEPQYGRAFLCAKTRIFG